MTAERIHAPQVQLYKESTIPWAPVIPNHWETKRAKSLFKKMERPVRESDEVVTCFRDGTVTLRRNRRESGFTESLKEIGYQGIRPGDLVIHAMDAFAGAIGVSDSAGKGTPVYSVCTPIGEANPLYYAHALREMSRNKWIESLAKGIRERSSDFRFTEFSGQVVPVPPPEEQAAIVRFLDHADEQIQRYIASKERLIALLEEERQALVHQAVTRGLDPNVRLKDSGVEWLGDVPEHWGIVKLGLLADKFGSGITPRGGATVYQEAGVPNPEKPNVIHFDGLRLDGVARITPDLHEELSSSHVQPGDVLLNITGFVHWKGLHSEPADFGYKVSSQPACLHHQAETRYHHNSPDLSAYLSTPMMQNEIQVEAKRSITPRPNSPIRIKDFRITVPPIFEQQSISGRITETNDTIFGMVAQARRQIDLMKEYRTRLIADVVTGKIDVREAKP